MAEQGSPETAPDANAFSRGVSYVLPAHIGRVVLLFGSWAIAARYLTPDAFGTFVMLTVACDALTLLADFGLTGTVVRFLAAGTGDARRTVAVACGFLLATSLIVSGVMVVAGDALLVLLGAVPHPYLGAAVAVLFFAQYWQTGMSAFLQGLGLYRRFAAVQLVEAALRIGLILVSLVVFELGLGGLVAAAVCASACSSLLAMLSLPWRVTPLFDRALLGELLRFGRPLLAQSAMGFAFERTDVMMIGSAMGPANVAAYDVAYKGPNQFRGLFTAFRSVFFPHIAGLYGSGRTADAETFLRSTLRTLSCLLAGGTLVAALFGRELIALVFSSSYEGSGPIFALLMAGVSIGLCNFLLGLALVAAGRPRAILRAGIPEAILNISANVVLIPLFGLVGAASASILSRAAVNPIFLYQMSGWRMWPTAACYLRSFANCGVAYGVYLATAPFGGWSRGLSLLVFVVLSMTTSGLEWSDVTFRHAGAAPRASR